MTGPTAARRGLAAALGRSPRPVGAPPSLRHTPVEDVAGLLTGTVVASLGLALLHAGRAATGGTAGIALLVAYATHASFGLLYLVVNLPFLALALWVKGVRFTVRTLLCVAAMSLFAQVHTAVLPAALPPVYGVLLGNLLVGVGMLVLFRHRGSLGGFNTVALIAQERLGWKAGWVQLALDGVVILAALILLTPAVVALSVLGAVVLNVVLALNHRPDRYLGG